MRLVYLSPVPWASFAQRPHKFVEWFYDRYEGEILWVDPYPTRLPQIGDFRFGQSAVVTGSPASIKPPTWLKVVRPRALPIEPLPGSGAFNWFLWRDVLNQIDQFLSKPDGLIGIGKPSELALQVLSRHQGVQSFYDAMDDFPAFYDGLSRQAMALRERALTAQVSSILVSSTNSVRRFNACKTKVFIALNACATEILPPDELISRKAMVPILGYVGTIGHWFDWTLVIALANANPQMRIRLIGPVYSPSPDRLPSNIELLPVCAHDKALLAIQNFSVGLIPFKQSELTASVDPIKYYEYRALGLPVVSTYFGEMILRENEDGVFLVNSQSNLASVVARALTYESNKYERQQFRNENSWGARFDSCGLFA